MWQIRMEHAYNVKKHSMFITLWVGANQPYNLKLSVNRQKGYRLREFAPELA